MDQLYVEYSKDQFQSIIVDKSQEPELYEFVEYIKANGPRFNSYTKDQIEQYARRIYELRED